VAYAIATGIISREEVPDELFEHLALEIEFYAHAPDPPEDPQEALILCADDGTLQT
jgi:hypothetical protein